VQPLRLPREPAPAERVLRFLHRHGLLLLGVVFSAAHLAGAFGPRGAGVASIAFPPLAAAAAFAVGWRVLQASRGAPVPARLEMAFGILLSDGVYAVIQITGDGASPLHPLVFLLAAWFAVAPLERRVALGLLGVAVAQNALRYACARELHARWPSLAVQLAFTGVFALLYHLLLAGRLWALRQAEQEAVARRLREAEESARALRLAGNGAAREHSGSSRELVLGAVLEVQQAVGSVLEGAQLALGSHAVALYWLSDDETALSLRDGRCTAGLLERGPLPLGDALPGEVLRQGRSVRRCGRLPRAAWYGRAVPVRSVAAVPVVERAPDGAGWARGVLIADRLEEEPFSDREVRCLEEFARQIARAAEAERLAVELHRSGEAVERLRRAATVLNAVSTVAEAAGTTARLVLEAVPGLDLAAVTLVRGAAQSRVHAVAHAAGARAREVDGLEWDDDEGLVARAIRSGEALPPRAPSPGERPRVFDVPMGGFASLRVLPLAAGGRQLGTLVAGAHGRGLLDGAAAQRLQALAVLAAGALARAEALEQLAETSADPATGLVGGVRLDELAAVALREAGRYGQPLSVVRVRPDGADGAPAPAGVLRAAADALREAAREGDLAGRRGDSELVLVLPGIGAEEARERADRLRRRAEEMAAAAGMAHATVSAGIAAFPVHGTSLDDVSDAAGQALAQARDGGRGRIVLAGADRATRPAAAWSP